MTDAASVAQTLTVDLGAPTGPFHGGASGTLYGLYGPGVPSRNAVEGMYVRTVSTKAQDGPSTPVPTPWRSCRPSWRRVAGTSTSTATR